MGEAISKGRQEYSRWIDNHDGFNIRDEHFFNSVIFVHGDDAIQVSSTYARMQVPKTAWFIEVSGNLTAKANLKVPFPRTIGPSRADILCRVPLSTQQLVDEAPLSNLFWWKST